MKRAHIVAAMALLAWSGATLAVPPTLQKIKQSGAITIAYRESSVPFSYLDANKQPIGYAVELCLRVVEAVKRELKMPGLQIGWVPVTSQNRIPIIMEGKADIECGSTTNNADRRKQVAFTIPHYIAGAKMLVRAKDGGIRSIDELRGRTIVTTKGSTTVKIVQGLNTNRVLNIKLIEAKDHDESFAFVEQGKADAFVMDDVLLYSLRAGAKNPADFAVVGDFLSIEPLAIMLRKNDPEFKRLVDATISRIVTDFEIQKIYRKWFQSPIPPKGVNLNIPINYLLRDSFKFPTDKVGD